jgi:phosphatidylserine decarboxylase
MSVSEHLNRVAANIECEEVKRLKQQLASVMRIDVQRLREALAEAEKTEAILREALSRIGQVVIDAYRRGEGSVKEGET